MIPKAKKSKRIGTGKGALLDYDARSGNGSGSPNGSPTSPSPAPTSSKPPLSIPFPNKRKMAERKSKPPLVVWENGDSRALPTICIALSTVALAIGIGLSIPILPIIAGLALFFSVSVTVVSRLSRNREPSAKEVEEFKKNLRDTLDGYSLDFDEAFVESVANRRYGREDRGGDGLEQ